MSWTINKQMKGMIVPWLLGKLFYLSPVDLAEGSG